MRLPGPADTSFEERASEECWRLRVASATVPSGLQILDHRVLGRAGVEVGESEYTLVLPWKYWCPSTVTRTETGLTVRFSIYFDQRTTDAIAPGVTYERTRRASHEGPLAAHLIRIARRPGSSEVVPVSAGSSLGSVETVSAMARRSRAIAGINGAYFSTRSGHPLGLLMIDRELWTGPLFHRSALFLAPDRAMVGPTSLSERVVLSSGESYDLDGINLPRGANRLVAYTSRYGNRTGTPPDGREWLLDAEGGILNTVTGNGEIPPSGRVLSAHGQVADWLSNRLKLGQRLVFKQPLFELMPNVRHIIGAGPRLLMNGRIELLTEREQFRADVGIGRAPRTAVGITADGDLLLLVVDGRSPRHSVGLTLLELAEFLRERGAVDALNFDGGGSAAMTIRGELVSRPSDGAERPVANALLVIPSPGRAAAAP
ncbi:MAG: phosphodiester glycosidase family protein [Candidatus Sericytochromatia bacterium]|nr:phosphodiester glycosidase family protein [Candidatus Sericytochromatia bacterium]